MVKKLGQINYLLLSRAIKIVGTFDPEEVLPLIEEELMCSQIEELSSFLNWVHKNGKTFGSGNYEEVFAEYQKGM